jgi:hypothetical protein
MPLAAGTTHTATLASAPSSIKVKLLNPAGAKIAQMLAQITPAIVSQAVLHWAFEGDLTDTTGQYDLYALSYFKGPNSTTQKITPSNPIPASHWLPVGQGGRTALKASFRNTSLAAGSYGDYARFPISWSGDGLTYSFNFSICTPGDRSLPCVVWGNRGAANSYPLVSYEHTTSYQVQAAHWPTAHTANTDHMNDNGSNAPMEDVVDGFAADGTWHQCTCVTSFTTSNCTSKFYIDGVYTHERSANAGCSAAGNPSQTMDYLYFQMQLGYEGHSLAYVQDMRIYNTPLSDQEVADLYNGTVGA